MKDETKEILNKLLEYFKESNINGFGYEQDKLISYEEAKILLDCITNLQKENQKLKQPQIFIDTMDMEERYGQELYEDYLKEQLEDYKSRNEKANWWLKEMLKQAKSDETKAIINGTLELLLQGEDKDE